MIWGKTGVEYITETGLRLSGEAAPMVILITNGVEKGINLAAGRVSPFYTQ